MSDMTGASTSILIEVWAAEIKKAEDRTSLLAGIGCFTIILGIVGAGLIIWLMRDFLVYGLALGVIGLVLGFALIGVAIRGKVVSEKLAKKIIKTCESKSLSRALVVEALWNKKIPGDINKAVLTQVEPETAAALIAAEQEHEKIQSGTQPTSTRPGIPGKKVIKEVLQKQEEDPNKIGNVDIVWAANKSAVSQLMSLANDSDLDLRGAVSAAMGMSGTRDELIESANKISLSPARKVWCETTPIYRDKRGGGVYIMFEKLDDDICNERGLELLGTIDAKDYAAALCMAHGLDAKNLNV
jgi:hypothetical protein